MPLVPVAVPVAALPGSALNLLIESEANKWVECVIVLLKGDGRPIEGGWPGTVSEARRKLMACLRTHPPEAPPDTGEVTLLVDLLYSQAKRLWLGRCGG